MSQFKLYYLPLRGRAEQIRMILAAGGVQYDNVVVSMDQWPQHKMSRAIAPFAQLPSIELPDGEIIAQSGAIARYAAKLAGMYPADSIEAARADMIYEFAQDMNAISAILNFWPVTSESYTTNHASYFQNFPTCCTILEDLLAERIFFGGNAPHHGDFAMYYILDSSRTVEPECLVPFPSLQRWMRRIECIPAISLYLSDRPPPSEVGMCGSFIHTYGITPDTHK